MSTDLDAALRRALKRVQLSADFEDRLSARVRSEAKAVNTEDVGRLRSSVESDYSTSLQRLARWRRRALGFLTLDVLAIAAIIVIGEALVWRLLQSGAFRGKGEWVTSLLSSSALMGVAMLLPLALLVPLILDRMDYGRSPE